MAQVSAPINADDIRTLFGNPMLDVGYLCANQRPYWQYTASGQDAKYTNVAPSIVQASFAAGDTITAYQKIGIIYDGTSIASMESVGTITAATDTTITIDGVVYTYSGQTVDVYLRNINKWSKYKPIICTPDTPGMLGTDIDGVEDSRWASNRYGYAPVPASTSPIAAAALSYSYTRPQAHGNYYARLTDFYGYDSDAMPPSIITRAANNYDLGSVAGTSLQFSILVPESPALTMAQIASMCSGININNLYLAVVMVSATQSLIKTASTAGDNHTVEITETEARAAFSLGEVFEDYFVLTSLPVTSLSPIADIPAASYYPVPSNIEDSNPHKTTTIVNSKQVYVSFDTPVVQDTSHVNISQSVIGSNPTVFYFTALDSWNMYLNGTLKDSGTATTDKRVMVFPTTNNAPQSFVFKDSAGRQVAKVDIAWLTPSDSV